jgi:hypothetical protein
VPRTTENHNAKPGLIAYVVTGTIVGVSAGALAGAAGSLLTADARSALGALFALAATGLGLTELTGHRVALVQIDRETPYAWLEAGPIRWAIRNGANLGFGGLTRLGFWLWFVIPLGALLGGRPLIGALGWGAYAFVRTASAGWLLLLVDRRRLDPEKGDALLREVGRAGVATSAQLLAVGLSALLAIGL